MVYGSDYFTYAVWVLGTVGLAWTLRYVFPRVPELIAVGVGYIVSLVIAYEIGQLFDGPFFADHIELYLYYSILAWVDTEVLLPLVNWMLFLIPLCYAHQFLRTSDPGSLGTTFVPIVVALLLAAFGLTSKFTREAFPESIVTLPLIHLLVGSLFLLRVRQAKEPNKPGEGTA